jgi:hypothetical protein
MPASWPRFFCFRRVLFGLDRLLSVATRGGNDSVRQELAASILNCFINATT